jgi:hypothetical protein
MQFWSYKRFVAGRIRFFIEVALGGALAFAVASAGALLTWHFDPMFGVNPAPRWVGRLALFGSWLVLAAVLVSLRKRARRFAIVTALWATLFALIQVADMVGVV